MDRRALAMGRSERASHPGGMNSTTATPTLPAALRLGAVEIAVTDLDRSVGFYQDAIGLRLHHRDEASAAMGAGEEDLLILREDPDARPAGRHAGLYHFALLFPTREELARALARLAITRTPIDGASHHGISEAIYLPDPDGNGIELAADRPREQWGDLSDPTVSGPRPLDMPGLLTLVEGAEQEPYADPDLRVGHLHVHVGDVEGALAFWRDLIGFEVMTRFPSAAFVSAGGYHHHLGLNTWRGEGVPPAPEGIVGLRHWTIVLDDEAELDAVRERFAAAGVDHGLDDGRLTARDPWNIAVELTAAGR